MTRILDHFRFLSLGRLYLFVFFAFYSFNVSAQERIKWHTDVLVYGDNTEFFNPYRDGETLLGTASTVAIDVALSDRATLRGGIFVNNRVGSTRFAEQVRPVLSLTVNTGPSKFIFGTLDTVAEDSLLGPDLSGPHGLLPPLQLETLAFTRPNEGGLQWQLDGARIQQDAWVNWQRLNTAAHRERFDAGIRGRISLETQLPVSIGYQLHHVHEGGQLFDSGPVSDSFAGGPGVIVEPRIDFLDATSIETYLLWSKDVPNRAVETPNERGRGWFVRAAATKNGWRGHFIYWSANLWLKTEGDPHYGSRFENGTIFHSVRHYNEFGIAKAFYTSDGVSLEGSARMHKIELDYNYSFRILARIGFDLPLLSL